MANTVNSYRNIFGEDVSTVTLVSDMIANLQTRVANGESRITDLNVGSEIRNVFEALSEAMFRYLWEQDGIARNLFVKYASNNFLDDIGEPLGIMRKNGNRANGSVVFTISSPLSIDYTIYGGTRILSNRTGDRYILESDVVIKAGETWGNGLVYAEGIGDDYNVVANELTAFDTEQSLRGDITVTNPHAFENGSYGEDDESYRNRILKFMRSGSFGSVPYYEAHAESCSGVHDVAFVEPEKINAISPGRHSILNSNNQTVECNDCTAVCVVNSDTNKPPTAETLAEVEEYLINQHNILCGQEFHVQPAVNDILFFKISYYPAPNGHVAESEVLECLNTFFVGGWYEGVNNIHYDGVDIGQTVYKNQLIDALENMRSIHHVANISLLKWHKELSVIPKLEQWINENHIYGSDGTFEYNDILDFPDADDPEYQQNSATYHSNAVWRNISTSGVGTQAIYELVVDGYYFYKIKDNNTQGDNNAGEHELDESLTSYWMWGEKDFESITANVDAAFKIGALFSKDDNGHQFYLKELPSGGG